MYMTEKQFEFELKQLIKREKTLLDSIVEECNEHVGYVKPRPNFDGLYMSGHLDNRRYANIRGLEAFILYHSDLTADEIKNLIQSKPLVFKFLNNLQKVMPESIEMIATEGSFRFAQCYINKCELMEKTKYKGK